MDSDLNYTTKLIKDYVSTCGGIVPLNILNIDYRDACGSDIPFFEFGYQDLVEFLVSITGLTIKKTNGEYYVHGILKSPSKLSSNSSISDEFEDDISELCYDVKNTLFLECKNGKRSVTIKPVNQLQESVFTDDHKNVKNSLFLECKNGRRSVTIKPVNRLQENVFTYDQTDLHSENHENKFESYLKNELSNISKRLDQIAGNASDDADVDSCDENTSDDFSISQPLNQIRENGINDKFVDWIDKNASECLYDKRLNSENRKYSISESDECMFTKEWTHYDSQNFLSSKYVNCYHYELLLNYIIENGLELPTIETYSNYSVAKNYIDHVTILRTGSEGFISSPYISDFKELAMEELFEKAFKLLTSKTNSSVTEKDFVTNLVHLVSTHETILTGKMVKETFRKLFNILLPENWVDVLDSLSIVYIERISSDTIIYPNRVFQTSTPSLSSLPLITLPNHDSWSIFVSECTSTKNIWFRLMENDYDIKYDTLVREMNKHYNKNIVSNVKSVKEEELYAVYIDAIWMRGEVLCNKEDNVTCFLIDSGKTKTFKLNELVPLDEKFTNTPPLVIHCYLDRLEGYAEIEFISIKLKELILNKPAIAKECSYTEKHFISSVIFVEPEINVNEMLFRKIQHELYIPKMELNAIYDMNIIGIDEDKTARIRIINDSFNRLETCIKAAKKIIDENPNHFYIKSLLKISLNQIYLSKYIDDSWQRIIVQKILSMNKISVLFIDYGDTKIIEVKNVVECSHFPYLLTFIPPQVVKVTLCRLDIIVFKFLNKIWKENKFTAKVEKNEKYPVVRLYKKLSNSKELKPLTDIFAIITADSNEDFINGLTNMVSIDSLEILKKNCDSKI